MDVGSIIQAFGPDGEDNTYGVAAWIDWRSDDSESPYTAGEVIELHYGAGSTPPVVDDYTFVFSKP